MSSAEFNTTRLHQLVDRLRQGDRAAGDILIGAAVKRMERLARKQMNTSPILRRWTDAEDILQNALVRLHTGLQSFRPDNTRAFYGYAAEQIRREIIELARQLRGPSGLAANFDSHPDLSDPPAWTELAEELEQWAAFHQIVHNLEGQQGEIFRLHYYNGLENEEIAGVLGIEVGSVERSLRRARGDLAKWVAARMGDVVGGE